MNINLRQWCLRKDEGAFRQLVERADHRLSDGFYPEYCAEGSECRWIMGMVDRLVYGKELHYAVDVDGKVVGCVNVSRWDGVYKRMGELRLVLLPEMCGQGIGTQVVKLIVQKAFYCDQYEIGGFKRLHASVFGENKAAERVLEKNGFVCEGVLRNAVSKGSHTYDKKVYGLVMPDSEQVSKPLSKEQSERIAYIKNILDNGLKPNQIWMSH